jgi:hypothetical protein
VWAPCEPAVRKEEERKHKTWNRGVGVWLEKISSIIIMEKKS